jgi:hypothetical protein
MRTVHYVGFRGDEYVRAHKIFGGPVYIHRDDDVVIFGPKYKKLPYVWDASAVDRRYTE